MESFLDIVTSFPTAVYTVLLLVVTVHWLLSALGILHIDTIDGLLPDGFGGHDLGIDLGGHGHGHGHGHGGDAGGFLMKFGLHGVPVMVVFTIIAIVGWLFCYFTDLFVLRALPVGLIAGVARTATAISGLAVSIPVGRLVLTPVRRIMRRYEPTSQRPLLGRYATVRSPEVTRESGTAEVDDGGAGLILQVRTDVPGEFIRGDRVVLIEYLEDRNAYRVMAAEAFERL